MSGFYMRVLASDHVFYQGRVEAVTLPGDDGERTVLAHHADSIISIREGELRFRDVEENWHEAIVGLGFAEMINNRLTILVDTAERPEDIDRKRAEEAKARAEEQLLSEAEHAGILHAQSIPRPCDDQTECDEQKEYSINQKPAAFG